MSSKRGFSLIEAVLALTIGSGLTLIGVNLVQRMMRLRSDTMNHIEIDNSLARWELRFRRDVRTSLSASLLPNGGLELESELGGKVVYRSENGQLLRQVSDSTSSGRDAVALSTAAGFAKQPVEFELRDGLIRLMFVRSGLLVPASNPQERIDKSWVAKVGRWSRNRTESATQAEIGETQDFGEARP